MSRPRPSEALASMSFFAVGPGETEPREWTIGEYDQAGGDFDALIDMAYTPDDPHGVLAEWAKKYIWLKGIRKTGS